MTGPRTLVVLGLTMLTLAGCSGGTPEASPSITPEQAFLHDVRVVSNPGDVADDSPFFNLSDDTLITAAHAVCDAIPGSSSILDIQRGSGIRDMLGVPQNAISVVVVDAVVFLCPDQTDRFEAITGVNLPG